MLFTATWMDLKLILSEVSWEYFLIQFSSGTQSCLFVTSWTAAHQASLSITNSQSLLKLMNIKSVMPSNHASSVIPFSSCLQSFPASGSSLISQIFASGGQSIYWSFSSTISLSIEYSGLISFRVDWFDLAVHFSY